MITQQDQINLFELICKELHKNISCYAFGGTAMMFYGYKDDTKDIDLYFAADEERKQFIVTIEKMGFRETSLKQIYIPEKMRDKHRPLMYIRDDIRFDLFAHKIIHTLLSPKMKEDKFASHKFQGQYSLTINVAKKEHIIMLKAVTERKNDFDDIKTIATKEKSIDWQYLIDEVLWQFRHGDSWVLVDTLKMLHELKKYLFIEQKYITQLTDALRKSKIK